MQRYVSISDFCVHTFCYILYAFCISIHCIIMHILGGYICKRINAHIVPLATKNPKVTDKKITYAMTILLFFKLIHLRACVDPFIIP